MAPLKIDCSQKNEKSHPLTQSLKKMRRPRLILKEQRG